MAKAKSRKGFTIIEVVLVLAVAGLIFLMVFVALPALQRSQKDTQRRDDYGMLSAAISSYSASNNGRLYKLAKVSKASENGCNPVNAVEAARFIKANGDEGQAVDPDGKEYVLEFCTWNGWNDKDGTIKSQPASAHVYVVIKANCNGSDGGHDSPASDESSRAFAVYGYLASGSGTYCSASQ